MLLPYCHLLQMMTRRCMAVQVALVEGYGLGFQVAGSDTNLRLRILPANMHVAGT